MQSLAIHKVTQPIPFSGGRAVQFEGDGPVGYGVIPTWDLDLLALFSATFHNTDCPFTLCLSAFHSNVVGPWYATTYSETKAVSSKSVVGRAVAYGKVQGHAG